MVEFNKIDNGLMVRYDSDPSALTSGTELL